MSLKSAVKRLPMAKTTSALLRDLNRKTLFESWSRRNEQRGTESKSGPGSSLSQTEGVRLELPRLIQDFGITSLLDIPCGDFHWMKHVDLGSIRYVGADILGELTAANQKVYGSRLREFRVLDLTSEELPRVDLVLCRDCLVHLSFRLIRKSLTRVKLSRSRYLLTTTFPGLKENLDTYTGCWRPLNLNATPFCFPPPLRMIDEQHPEEAYSDKSLGLWAVDSIPSF